MRRGFAVAVAIVALSGCRTYHDTLVRSQHAFEQNQHAQALGLLRNLEPDVSSLSTPEQATYAYLRGMTDYRIGYVQDARHWLSLAKTYEDASPGVLPADWKARLGEALDEMNVIVYDEGLVALSNSRKAGEEETPRPASSAKAAPSSSPSPSP